mmetsp:Transcript_70173/g.157668  ORF Transcript_70173/g.157668 Transcript_70173/m.157668 type:complete len:133 (-) Transcript_70173:81-479(-)
MQQQDGKEAEAEALAQEDVGDDKAEGVGSGTIGVDGNSIAECLCADDLWEPLDAHEMEQDLEVEQEQEEQGALVEAAETGEAAAEDVDADGDLYFVDVDGDTAAESAGKSDEVSSARCRHVVDAHALAEGGA